MSTPNQEQRNAERRRGPSHSSSSDASFHTSNTSPSMIHTPLYRTNMAEETSTGLPLGPPGLASYLPRMMPSPAHTVVINPGTTQPKPLSASVEKVDLTATAAAAGPSDVADFLTHTFASQCWDTGTEISDLQLGTGGNVLEKEVEDEAEEDVSDEPLSESMRAFLLGTATDLGRGAENEPGTEQKVKAESARSANVDTATSQYQHTQPWWSTQPPHTPTGKSEISAAQPDIPTTKDTASGNAQDFSLEKPAIKKRAIRPPPLDLAKEASPIFKPCRKDDTPNSRLSPLSPTIPFTGYLTQEELSDPYLNSQVFDTRTRSRVGIWYGPSGNEDSREETKLRLAEEEERRKKEAAVMKNAQGNNIDDMAGELADAMTTSLSKTAGHDAHHDPTTRPDNVSKTDHTRASTNDASQRPRVPQGAMYTASALDKKRGPLRTTSDGNLIEEETGDWLFLDTKEVGQRPSPRRAREGLPEAKNGANGMVAPRKKSWGGLW